MTSLHHVLCCCCCCCCDPRPCQQGSKEGPLTRTTDNSQSVVVIVVVAAASPQVETGDVEVPDAGLHGPTRVLHLAVENDPRALPRPQQDSILHRIMLVLAVFRSVLGPESSPPAHEGIRLRQQDIDRDCEVVLVDFELPTAGVLVDSGFAWRVREVFLPQPRLLAEQLLCNMRQLFLEEREHSVFDDDFRELLGHEPKIADPQPLQTRVSSCRRIAAGQLPLKLPRPKVKMPLGGVSKHKALCLAEKVWYQDDAVAQEGSRTFCDPDFMVASQKPLTA
mmetsp:Transcript_30280/g.54215  ORF Transcript_30280/g.54215 Transcript_30280/m.54215 type:complete len:279 (+) Transcript_30280:176-1012(+)